jgi:hypothetical protein
MENPEKPKMRIVHNNINPENPKQSKELDKPVKLDINEIDLKFLDGIEEVIEMDEESRKAVLENLYNLLEKYSNANKDNNPDKEYLSYILKVYNQIYKFEPDGAEKDLVKQKIQQIEFALRQLLLS